MNTLSSVLEVKKINILIIEKHPFMAKGIKDVIDLEEDMQATFMANPIELNLKALDKLNKYDIFIVDINLVNLNKMDVVKEIRTYYPESICILYIESDVSNCYKSLMERKIDGFIHKTAEPKEFIKSLKAIINNELVVSEDFLNYIRQEGNASSKYNSLTLVERKTLKMVKEGNTNKAISIELKVCQRTVENYLSRIFSKLDVETRVEAVVKAIDEKII
ncbi:LuxR C-terminal-related transcriptional regulator [Viridibacillus arvi]|uniref:LuxR C-terminal-related transcriptional regulator n=1 Tax=Viridibacillus arvi TaxID=263475 RepID=UPI003D010243